MKMMNNSSAYHLEDLSSRDTMLLAYLLSFAGTKNAPIEAWLAKQAEIINTLPYKLQKPKCVIPRLLNALSPTINTAQLCQAHQGLNASLVHEIFRLLEAECTKRMAKIDVNSEGDLRFIGREDERREVEAWGRRMKERALWFKPGFREMVAAGDGCEACELALVGGHEKTLCDLMTSLFGRRKRVGQARPRLLALVEAWVAVSGYGAAVRAESGWLAGVIKRWRRGIRNAQRIRDYDRGGTPGKHASVGDVETRPYRNYHDPGIGHRRAAKNAQGGREVESKEIHELSHGNDYPASIIDCYVPPPESPGSEHRYIREGGPKKVQVHNINTAIIPEMEAIEIVNEALLSPISTDSREIDVAYRYLIVSELEATPENLQELSPLLARQPPRLSTSFDTRSHGWVPLESSPKTRYAASSVYSEGGNVSASILSNGGDLRMTSDAYARYYRRMIDDNARNIPVAETERRLIGIEEVEEGRWVEVKQGRYLT